MRRGLLLYLFIDAFRNNTVVRFLYQNVNGTALQFFKFLFKSFFFLFQGSYTRVRAVYLAVLFVYSRLQKGYLFISFFKLLFKLLRFLNANFIKIIFLCKLFKFFCGDIPEHIKDLKADSTVLLQTRTVGLINPYVLIRLRRSERKNSSAGFVHVVLKAFKASFLEYFPVLDRFKKFSRFGKGLRLYAALVDYLLLIKFQSGKFNVLLI